MRIFQRRIWRPAAGVVTERAAIDEQRSIAIDPSAERYVHRYTTNGDGEEVAIATRLLVLW